MMFHKNNHVDHGFSFLLMFTGGYSLRFFILLVIMDSLRDPKNGWSNTDQSICGSLKLAEGPKS